MHFRGWITFIFIIIAAVAVVNFSLPSSSHAEDAKKPDIFAPADKDACLNCHEDKINIKHFGPSAHGKLNCQDCHKGIDRYPHPDYAVKKPQCLTCHADKDTALAHSVHAKRDSTQKATPYCQSCHGTNPHEISKVKQLTSDLKEASCRNCHPEKASALAGSVHGAHGNASGRPRPGCLACHGSNPHAIAPPAKSTSPKHDAPCLRCHTADTARMLGDAHGRASQKTGKRLDCLACHGNNPHAITPPLQAASPEKTAMCEKCHADKAAMLQKSAHGHTDMQGGNRPNCLTCHGESLHAIMPTSSMVPQQKDAACRSCHNDIAQDLSGSVHSHTAAGKETSCLTCHGGGNPHDVHSTSTMSRQDKEAGCKSCHSNLSPTLQHSVHDRPDKVPGDHPTCLSCHGGSPHRIKKPAALAPIQKVELCAKCHADTARMARYGRTDAVAAYERTYHGRAILRFHHTKEATCTDCHGLHGIMDPNDPNAPVSPRHAGGQVCTKCHHGNTMNFAYSYAGHLRLNIERSLIDPLSVFFPRAMFGFALLGLLGLVTLGVQCGVTGGRSASSAASLLSALMLFALVTALTTLITVAILTRLGTQISPGFTQAALSLLVLAGLAQVTRYIIGRLRPTLSPGNIDTDHREKG